jgi:hypothetical protein
MAKHPVTFFIRIGTCYLIKFENICLENGETNEKLVVKKWFDAVPISRAVLISRFPMAANSAKWIQANEQEVLEFGPVSHDRTISLDVYFGPEVPKIKR